MFTPNFTFRPAEAGDFDSWPDLLPAGSMAPELPPSLPGLWAALLEEGAMEARTIVSDADGDSVEAFGASVFLRPGVLDTFHGLSRPRFAEWIYRSLLAGETPLLSGRELARANARDGLDVCVLHFCQRLNDLNDPLGQQLLALGHAAFRDAHEGYNLNTVVHETFGGTHRDFLLAGGFELLREFSDEAGPSCLVAMTRARSAELVTGSPISLLFHSSQPRYYFSPSERRVLRAALAGQTDKDAARRLGITPDAVKKAWRSVFERMEAFHGQQLIGDEVRGRRRSLLEYLRQHPEELRPYERPPGWPKQLLRN
ncbi:MAG: helix-turn-helix transcriptional regulator [Pseudomonadales bacterium]